MMRKCWMTVVFLLAIVSGGVAQVDFKADGNSSLVVPPVPANFRVLFTFLHLVNTPGGQVMTAAGYSNGPISKVEVFEGKPGVAGTRALFSFPIVRTVEFKGTTRVLAFREIQKLKSGCYYLQAETTDTPPRLIRAQIVPNTTDYAAHLDGKGANPATPSTAEASVEFDINYPLSFNYTITDNVPNKAGVFLVDRTNPLVTLELQGTQGTVNNFSWVDRIADENVRVIIKSALFPNGEVGGCAVPSSSSYGEPCPHSNGTAVLKVEGAPTSRGDIRICVTGGVPNEQNFVVAIAGAPEAVDVGACHFAIDLGSILTVLLVSLDAQGNGKIRIDNLPDLAGKQVVYLQGGGLAPGRRPYLTNALKLVLQPCPQ